MKDENRGCEKVCDSARFLCDFAHSAQRVLLKDVKNESFFHTKRRLFNKKWRSCPKLFKKNLEKVDDVLLKTPSHILFCEGEFIFCESGEYSVRLLTGIFISLLQTIISIDFLDRKPL